MHLIVYLTYKSWTANSHKKKYKLCHSEVSNFEDYMNYFNSRDCNVVPWKKKNIYITKFSNIRKNKEPGSQKAHNFFPTLPLPGGSGRKQSACNAGDMGSIHRSGRSLGRENGHPLQDSCLENPMDREAWWATIHEVAESDTTEHKSISQERIVARIKIEAINSQWNGQI